MITGIDFKEPLFMHAVTHVQDVRNGESYDYTNVYGLYQNYDIHIGNDPDYTKNQKCAGGPHLQFDDPGSYVYDALAFDRNEDAFGQGRGMVWRFGEEVWCNLEGRYVHLVADLSHLADPSQIDMSICTLGVFGTKYVRDGDPLPSSIELASGSTAVNLDITHIYSELTIGTELAINLRQASQLSFVTLVELDGRTQVVIDPSSLDQGEYELVLESYNTLSVAQSALKTDRI